MKGTFEKLKRNDNHNVSLCVNVDWLGEVIKKVQSSEVRRPCHDGNTTLLCSSVMHISKKMIFLKI